MRDNVEAVFSLLAFAQRAGGLQSKAQPVDGNADLQSKSDVLPDSLPHPRP